MTKDIISIRFFNHHLIEILANTLNFDHGAKRLYLENMKYT